jgi:hypothetical protein
LQAIALVHGPLDGPLQHFMWPEKILAMHYLPHGWMAVALAVPFVLVAPALEKRHGFASWLCEAVVWLLLSFW